MAQFLIDSGALLAMIDASDKYHIAAAEFVSLNDTATYLLPEAIFIESMTLVKARLGAQPAVELGKRIQDSKLFKLVNLSDIDREATWEIFSQYTDKAWSYADCSLLALAHRLDINEIFSFDHHIEQMSEVTRLPLNN